MSLFLQAQGWRADERLRVYLTNTLEQPAEMQPTLPFAEFISEEANAALSVKRDEPLLVILGNPPYPRDSANPSRVDGELTFIGQLIEDYKQIDGEPIGEKNVKALQADYVKFTRWAQWRINRNGEGIVGYIVNNSFLDGPVFRGMRKSLLDSFTSIYLLNLHGSSRRKEAIPTADRDENVFDIIQGVSILLCVKDRRHSPSSKVYYTDIWGLREEKYSVLSKTDVQDTSWSKLAPTSPYYLFVPQIIDRKAEYETGWKITNIFQASQVAIVTGRDKLTIHWTADKMRETVTDFASLPETKAREKYKLRKDSRDWRVHFAQTDLRNHPDVEKHIVPIYYRPFDARWTYYTGQSAGFHREARQDIMQHLQSATNFALCVCRVVKSPIWQHALITDKITEKCYISNRTSESTHVFPLYLYPNPEELGLSTERSLNFKPAFLTALSEALELPQVAPFNLPESVSPEQILAYIYAILYSPTYRERYYDFLKYDFPRIPLPEDIEQFRTLAALGQRLMDCHLLKASRPEVAPTERGVPAVHRFEGEGDGVVGRVRYMDRRVWINPTQYFTDVPAAVWEYEIGSYRVCEKWLKDRRGEVLRHEDVRRYRAILVAVAETLEVMGEIDGVLWTEV